MAAFLDAPIRPARTFNFPVGRPNAPFLSPASRVLAARAKVTELQRRDRLLKRKLERILEKFKNLTGDGVPLEIQKMVETQINREGWMERIIERRFKAESEHGPGSRKWKQLRPSTVKRRGSAHPILYETGEMFAGAVAAVADTFRFRGVRKWNVADVGVEYAEYHQTGTDRMPARRFFDAPNEKELKPVVSRARDLVRAEIRKRLRALKG